MYCIDSEENSVPTVYFHLYVGSDVTETVDITSQKPLLLLRFTNLQTTLRPGIDGWTQLCCMCQRALYHSWYRTHQNTSTILLSWFSCAFCVYYYWFRIESASRSLIQSTHYCDGTNDDVSASACLRFGGLKSFLSFPVSLQFLYCLSDYISRMYAWSVFYAKTGDACMSLLGVCGMLERELHAFTMRVITVLCVLVCQCEVSWQYYFLYWLGRSWSWQSVHTCLTQVFGTPEVANIMQQ